MKHKRILTVVVALVMILGLTIPALASIATKNITVETDVKVFVNDKALDAGDTHGNPDCFIYNGTTYVAVAAVSKSLGQKVKWEGGTRSVYIGAHKGSGDAAQSRSESLSFGDGSVTKDLTVEEYHLRDDWGSRYAFFVIENHSDKNLEINAEIKFYNKNGELVGAKSIGEDAVEKKTKTIIYCSVDEEYESVTYELTTTEEKYYDCVTAKLSYETVSAKDKEVVSVTNNGDIAAEYVEGFALFFKDGKIVDFDSTYFVDNDSEIKPGKTITRELDCYEVYDAVRIYFTGRGHK